MGSRAYGTEREDSDYDVYGFTIPPRDYLYFPDLIAGFDYDPKCKFNQYQIQIEGSRPQDGLDVHIYNITKYFKLVMDNNPNMIDSLFTRDNCVLCATDIGKLVRTNRHMFPHSGVKQKMIGYAHSQLSKIKTNPDEKKSPQRKALIEKYGYDTKFALHVFRLLGEAEQLLSTGTLDLMKDRERLKRVVKGTYTLEEIEAYFKVQELSLQKLYDDSVLPHGPPVEDIRGLLKECLRMYYPDLKL